MSGVDWAPPPPHPVLLMSAAWAAFTLSCQLDHVMRSPPLERFLGEARLVRRRRVLRPRFVDSFRHELPFCSSPCSLSPLFLLFSSCLPPSPPPPPPVRGLRAGTSGDARLGLRTRELGGSWSALCVCAADHYDMLCAQFFVTRCAQRFWPRHHPKFGLHRPPIPRAVFVGTAASDRARHEQVTEQIRIVHRFSPHTSARVVLAKS